MWAMMVARRSRAFLSSEVRSMECLTQPLPTAHDSARRPQQLPSHLRPWNDCVDASKIWFQYFSGPSTAQDVKDWRSLSGLPVGVALSCLLACWLAVLLAWLRAHP